MWDDDDTARVLGVIEAALPERYRTLVCMGYFADALAEMVTDVDAKDRAKNFDVLAHFNAEPRSRLRLVPDGGGSAS